MSNLGDSYYMVASYRSSKKLYFPLNQPDKFRLKFVKPLILLEGRWKVALIDINFANIYEKDTVHSETAYYTVSFSDCEGFLIDGEPTRVLRCEPLPTNSHTVFDNFFYVPVTANYLDTCSVEVKTFNLVKKVNLPFKDTSDIRVTLHFRRTLSLV